MMQTGPVLVISATEYAGGRLVQLLQGPDKMSGWAFILEDQNPSMAKRPQTWFCTFGDAQFCFSLVCGQRMLFSLLSRKFIGRIDRYFAKLDRITAYNMTRPAEVVTLERIIYLGHFVEKDPHFSKYHNSKSEVVNILSSGTVSVTLLRTGMIIGTVGNSDTLNCHQRAW